MQELILEKYEVANFVKKLRPHLLEKKILLLKGDLGSGKTHLVQTLCAELSGAANLAKSPTFTIYNDYHFNENLRMRHFDLYRIGRVDEAIFFALKEALENDFLLCVEWADFLEGMHAEIFSNREYLLLELEYSSPEKRIYKLTNSSGYKA
jgi:tRNA threonylcarbamoyladenosine biosynthesis protein TsaE